MGLIAALDDLFVSANELTRSIKKTINNHYWEKYKHFRNNCVSEIREAKISYYDNSYRQKL